MLIYVDKCVIETRVNDLCFFFARKILKARFSSGKTRYLINLLLLFSFMLQT
ncbi:hypothetical protein HanIR_Chr03g0138421 [Helianthus annuus]|nr:hypothetical protein HanIR_Chr03g0138421 [Helianthus annuus]